MIAVLSLLLRCLSILGVLVAANVVAPSTVWGYEAQSRPSTAYDGASLSAFDYESASALAICEKQSGATGNRVPFAKFAGFLAAKTSLWTSTKSKTAVENAFGHWQKHGAEFPEFQNAKQYVEGAKNFFNNPPSGTLTKVRPDGDKLFYNPANNTFGVQAADGAPRTMLRPTDGINYWNRQ